MVGQHLAGGGGVSDRTQLSTWSRMLCPDTENRDRDDFYPTPPGAITPLLAKERFDGLIWEPACGNGIMSETLKRAGYDVISTDLVDRGYGTGGVDFLLDYQTKADHVVTNPPFRYAQAFAEHALMRVAGKVALLARLQWLESGPRKSFFDRSPLARVYIFANRVPFQRNRLVEPGEKGGRMMAYAWFVFDHAHAGKPTLDWIKYEEMEVAA